MSNGHWSAVLGMNARTLRYIAAANATAAMRLANRKLATKRALQKAGIPTPRLFATVRSRQELKNFRWTRLPAAFALKPNSASGGAGIIVIFGRNKKGNWVKADRSEVFIPALKHHIIDILDGNFSPSSVPDVAFFEQRVKVHSVLKPYTVRGIPDIRVLVYNLVPIMAMLRLPTAESGGRANLHSGGIGVGIDLASGMTTHAIRRGMMVETIPERRLKLSGLVIPEWMAILAMAARAAQAANLRYAGVDIALDREDGPLVLEINARPGLDIQLANLAPAQSRLRRVEGLAVLTPWQGVELAKNLFAGQDSMVAPTAAESPILGIEERVVILDSDGQDQPVVAKVDTGAYRTTIDEELAKKFGLHKTILHYKKVRGSLGRQTRPIVAATLKIRGRTIKTEAFVADRSIMKYDVILGRRDLRGFLVNPAARL